MTRVPPTTTNLFGFSEREVDTGGIAQIVLVAAGEGIAKPSQQVVDFAWPDGDGLVNRDVHAATNAMAKASPVGAFEKLQVPGSGWQICLNALPYTLECAAPNSRWPKGCK